MGEASPSHVYLSPHLDDAVLSCGGAIHRHVAAGEPVLVVTLFAAEAEVGLPLSPFALEQHAYWGHVPWPMTLRRAEDVAALTRLGAEARHLDYRDAVYRVGPEGQWLYTDVAALYGEVHPGDPLAEGQARWLAERLAGLVPAPDALTLYAPLNIFHHVDHQIVHWAARHLQNWGYRLAFYEDYPYAERDGALERALAVAGAESWRAEIVVLEAADLAAKVGALGYYRSQMAVLFGGAEAMPSRVWAFAAARSPEAGLAECIWWPTPPSPQPSPPKGRGSKLPASGGGGEPHA
jgi:LmbE family N-acetylglucosaminyl deacetylase